MSKIIICIENYASYLYNKNMKKVVIIGGGPAGLTAAYHLLKNGKEYEVIILEKDDTLGGISKTVSYDGNRMDLGGHRFFTKSKKVMDFWFEVLPFDEKEKKEKCFIKQRRVSRIFYKKRFFDYPVNLSFKTIRNLGLKDTIISGFSYLKSLIHKLPEDNLENFYINRFGKKLYEIFFKEYTTKLWGIEPSMIDSSWGSQRVKGISIWEVIKDYFKRFLKIKDKKKQISLIEEFYYPKLGPGMFYTELARKIENMGGKIYKNCDVFKITKDSNVIKEVTYTENGKTKKITCDYLISSMPIKDLCSSINDVPKKITNISNKLPYRDFLTVGLIVDKLKITNNTKYQTYNNIIPDTWIYVQSKDVKLGRIQIFNNWSKYMVKNNNTISLGLEYFCQENDNFWKMSDKELKEYSFNELKKMEIIGDDTKILDFHIERVKKAYPAYFGSYKYFYEVKKYLDSIDNLFCIGRNGMHRYNNMDHSIETAMEAVDCIINKTSKDNIWNVNTDVDYHEEQKNNSVKKRRFTSYTMVFIASLLAFILLYAQFHLERDFWFILKIGDIIREKGFIMYDNLTIHGSLYFISQQWLCAVLFSIIYNNFNVIGMFVFLIVSAVIIFISGYKLCKLVSNNDYFASIVTLFGCVILYLYTQIGTVPRIFDIIFLTIELFLLESYLKKKNIKYLYFLPVISILLINLHASIWPMIFVFMLPYYVEYFWNKYRQKENFKLKPIIIWTLITLLSGFINPYGIKSMLYLFNSYGIDIINKTVIEMQPVVITDIRGKVLYLIILISIVSFYYNKGHNKLRYFLLFLGTSYLSLSHLRGILFLCVASFAFLSYNYRKLINFKEAEIARKDKIVFLICCIFFIILFVFRIQFEDNNAIEKIVNYLDTNATKDIKIYTSYINANANYLEYHDYKCYIDARAELFFKKNNKKKDIFLEYYNLYTGILSPSEFIKKYDFDYVLINSYDYVMLKEMPSNDNYELVLQEKDSDIYDNTVYFLYHKKSADKPLK